MNIKKFNIENFRSLKNLKIDEFDKTTIFYGENNAGKSNILNALYLIFSRKPKLNSDTSLSQFENFYEGVVMDSRNSFFNNDTSSPISFSVDIEVSKPELAIDDEIKQVFKKGTNFTFTFEGTMTFDEKSDVDYSDFKIEIIKVGTTIIYTTKKGIAYFPTLDKNQKKQSELNRAFSKLVNLFNGCVHVISSHRDMHEASITITDPGDLSPKNFKKFLYDLYLSPKKFTLFEQINNVFSQSPFSFGTISFSNDGGKLEIMIKEKDFRLPIKHLGSGALQALYIITSIVCSKSKIVCLEELEQNLSPRKQFEILKKIQAMIEEPGLSLNQLIISSHSAVYSKPKLGLIYFLEKIDGKSNINHKETAKISSKLRTHLAPTYTPMTDKEFEEFKKYMKTEHDFF